MTTLGHEHLIGFAPILDEAECIRGWAKNIRLFCDEVYALVDPKTSDETIDILKKDCPWVIIDLQKSDLWESIHQFLRTYVEELKWCLWLNADERLHPAQVEPIRRLVDLASSSNYDAISLGIVDLYPDIFHRLAFEKVPNFQFVHKKIFRRTTNLRFYPDIPGAETGLYNTLSSQFPFWHFGYLKKNPNKKWVGLNITDKTCSTSIPFKNWQESI